MIFPACPSDKDDIADRLGPHKKFVAKVHLPLAYLPFHRYGQDSAHGVRRDGIPVQQVKGKYITKSKKITNPLRRATLASQSKDISKKSTNHAYDERIKCFFCACIVHP